MAKPRQSSFRRILVTRILLLFVPVLLLGELVALNKARSSLLSTARQNLTESAVIKGEKIVNAIATLKNSALIASQTTVLRSGSPSQMQNFLNQLAQQLPNYVECIQITSLQDGDITASTCGNKAIAEPKLTFASKDAIVIKTILPPKAGTTGKRDPENQIKLVLSAPIYSQNGQLTYALNIESSLYKQNLTGPGSLTGSTLVIAEDGTILAHPVSERIGTNLQEHPDAKGLQNIIQNAVTGQSNSVNLSLQQGKELVAGYSVIANPITQKPEKWIVLAVTSVDNALLGLEEIKLILIVLTVGLICASLVASLYLAPYLAGPVEELRDYVLNIHSHYAAQTVPQNFKIREFNQLAQAIDQMFERLKAWSEELELAWKEAKTANQIKSQFLATTSHELRNPLNIIINCVRFVREDMCDSREEEIEFLKRADETAIHLLGIINDLLDISKIEAGKLSVVLAPIDLRQALLEVINLQSINVQQKGLQLKTLLGTEPIPVKADAAKLRQVLINIIGNATKFTDEGSITIATTFQTHNGKSQAIVSVTDTGLGIEPTQQSKLFRPFVRVDAETTRKFDGTGLGLAISRNLIELMGGSITLESAGLNQGTTVKIILPILDSSEVSNSTEKDHVENVVVASNEVNSYSSTKENAKSSEDNYQLPLVENIAKT
jgi:signal transduction histidine kinase